MFEYISEFERWKKINPEYKQNIKYINDFTYDCIKQCKLEDEICIDSCKKPIIDIERFNVNMMKRLTVDVYEICSSKIDLNRNENIINDISKMKNCVENLYRENEIIIKKETLERISDMIKFLNL